jgi:hypothetical protein
MVTDMEQPEHPAAEPEQVLVAAAAMDEPERDLPATSSAEGESDVLVTAQQIDDFFARARREHAAGYDPRASSVIEEMLGNVDQFTAVDLVQAYRAGGIYPEDRLRDLVNRFTDVRLQTWYVRFDGGLANGQFYAPIHFDP